MRRACPPAAFVPLVAAAAVAVLLSGCTQPAPAPTRSPRPTPTASVDRGPLVIGAEFPVTGSASYLGPAQASAVDAAVHDINAAGGVLGRPVTVVHADSGDASTGLPEQSFQALVARHADVVVGPSSSVLAERLVPAAVKAGVPIITPASTSVRLTGLDDDGLLFRTIASAALQGPAIARELGTAKVAVLSVDDQTGQAVTASLAAALKQGGGTLVAAQHFAATAPAATVDAAVAAVAAAKPDAVVYVSPFTAMDQNKAVITQLDAAGLGGAKLWLTNDNMADYSQALPAGALTNVNGLLAGATPDAGFAALMKATNPAATDLLYAPEAYDATILAALSATVAGSADGRTVARGLRAVSAGGIKCTSYAECLRVLKTQKDIDYDGASGPVNLDAAGDQAFAPFGLYRYDGTGHFARVGSVLAG